MLWLDLHLPHLGLDLLRQAAAGKGTGGGEPLVLFEVTGGRQRVHDRNRAAARHGIRPGQTLGEALALHDRLILWERDRRSELQALRGIAAWAVQFTPRLSLQPPRDVLLEISGSLRLFGGLPPLLRRVEEGMESLGHHARAGVAPTPLAATLLARAGIREPILTTEALARTLRPLPLTLLDRPAPLLERLERMGLHTIGELLRQPREALARRLGGELLLHLDRLLGRLPDPRIPFAPPDRFDRRLPLPAETHQSEALLFAIRRLLLELAGLLQARGRGATRLRLELTSRHALPERLDLSLGAPSRDVEHLLSLWRHRLERTPLQAPVEEIRLTVLDLAPLAPRQTELGTGDDKGRDETWQRVVERLRARLGEDHLLSLATLADHRPERAWERRPAGAGEGAPPPGERPLWLLPEPTPLAVEAETPSLRGPLTIRQGPERIESGWWDGADVARDYFVAENPHHERYWIFRELRHPHRWFVHGIFA